MGDYDGPEIISRGSFSDMKTFPNFVTADGEITRLPSNWKERDAILKALENGDTSLAEILRITED